MTKIPPLPPGVPKDPPKAPPGLPQAPLADASDLKVGDVVQIAVHREDRQRGGHYWWKRFAVVTKIGFGGRSIDVINLKMHPNLEKFVKGTDVHRHLSFSTSPWDEPQVITKLREPWPQGIAAMHMKYLALKIIKLGDE